MSQRSKEYAKKARMRSLATIAVRNNTSNDFIFDFDKTGPEARRVMVPKAQKDIGHGKGINHLPRHLAKKYAKDMAVQIITKISDDDWKEKKKAYRTLDETIQHASQAIRTNDMNYWYQYIPYKANLDNPYNGEAPEEIEEKERAFRKANDIKIPVKKLIWLGLVRKYETDDIPKEEKPVIFSDENPFA